MVTVKDIEVLMDDFFIEREEKFIEIKRYLLSEFNWKVDKSKNTQFVIRGIPLEDNRELSNILGAFLPDEVILLKEV